MKVERADSFRLHYINKGRIVADTALNTLHGDMCLKELQLCGTSQNQIYSNQLQNIFKTEKAH